MPLFGRLGRTLFACFGKGGTVERHRSVATKESPSDRQSKQQAPTDDREESDILEPAKPAPEAVPRPEHDVATMEENAQHDISNHPPAENLSTPNESEATQQDSEFSNVDREKPEVVESSMSEAVFTALNKQSAAFGAGQLQESPIDGQPASVQPSPGVPEENGQRTESESSGEVPSLSHQNAESSKSGVEETAVPGPEHDVATMEESAQHISNHPPADNLSTPNESEATQQDSEFSNVDREKPEVFESSMSEAVFTALNKQSAAFGANQPQESPTDGQPASVQPSPGVPEENGQRTESESSGEVPSLSHQNAESSKIGVEETAVPGPEHDVATMEESAQHDISNHPPAENLSTPNESEATQQDSESSNVDREKPEVVESSMSEAVFTALSKQSTAFGASQPQESPTDGQPASVQPSPGVPGENGQCTDSESSGEVPSLSYQNAESSKSGVEETDNLASAIPEAADEPEQSVSKHGLQDETTAHVSPAQQDVSVGEQHTELEPSAIALPPEDSEHKDQNSTPVFQPTTPEAVLVAEQYAANGMPQLQEETTLHKSPDQPTVVEQPPEDLPKSTEDEQPSDSTKEIRSSPQQDYTSTHQEANFEVADTPNTTAELEPSGVTTAAQDDISARVQREAVVLQSVEPSDNEITGYVHVRNDDYEKLVTARYTVDGWDSYREIQAEWTASTDAQKSDIFKFVIHSLVAPYKVHLSVHYEVLGRQYWDNNNNKNYKVVHGYDASN